MRGEVGVRALWTITLVRIGGVIRKTQECDGLVPALDPVPVGDDVDACKTARWLGPSPDPPLRSLTNWKMFFNSSRTSSGARKAKRPAGTHRLLRRCPVARDRVVHAALQRQTPKACPLTRGRLGNRPGASKRGAKRIVPSKRTRPRSAHVTDWAVPIRIRSLRLHNPLRSTSRLPE